LHKDAEAPARGGLIPRTDGDFNAPPGAPEKHALRHVDLPRQL